MTTRPVLASILCGAFAAVALGSCGSKAADTILPRDVSLEAGDLVFRRGGGLTSHAVLCADTHGRYSHVGMVVDSCGTKMVVHAVPGEPDYPGDADRVKMERPDCFFSGLKADEGCVVRHADSTSARRAANAAYAAYRRRALFDHGYDSRDTVRLYCCELVVLAFASAGCPLSVGAGHDITLPGLTLRQVVLPSDFFRDEKLRPVATF